MVMSLFVYGTLKQGFVNHAPFCAGVSAIEPAQLWGCLYDMPEGYPALIVPPTQILRYSTGDVVADLLLALPPPVWQRPPGDWQLIEGELLVFPDPPLQIPPIDRLEECDTGLYQRVWVPVLTAQGCVGAWVYDGSPMSPASRGQRLWQSWPAGE